MNVFCPWLMLVRRAIEQQTISGTKLPEYASRGLSLGGSRSSAPASTRATSVLGQSARRL